MGKNKDGVLKELEQKLNISKDFSIRAKYNDKKNEAKIFVKDKESDDEKLKEIKPRLIIFRLITKQGKLDFQY